MADTYDVVDQHQTVDVSRGRGFTDVMAVTIETKPSGITRVVNVPLRVYKDAAATSELLEAAAREAEAVHKL